MGMDNILKEIDGNIAEIMSRRQGKQGPSLKEINQHIWLSTFEGLPESLRPTPANERIGSDLAKYNNQWGHAFWEAQYNEAQSVRPDRALECVRGPRRPIPPSPLPMVLG